MRLCRFDSHSSTQLGFFDDSTIIPLMAAAAKTGISIPLLTDITSALPGGSQRQIVQEIQQRLGRMSASDLATLRVPADSVKLLVPVPSPSKLDRKSTRLNSSHG